MVLMVESTMWNVLAARGMSSVRDLLWFGASVIDGVDHEAEGNLYLFCNGKVSVKGAARRESFLKEFQFSQNR